MIIGNIMGNQASSQIPSPNKSSYDDKEAYNAASNSNPLSGDGSLTLSHVAGWEAEASVDPKTKLARTVLFHSDINQALTSRSAEIRDQHVFNLTLDFKTAPITNQKQSGRCWLFATTNVLRCTIMKRFKLKDFQFSQSYLFFWDKLNKSNYYLEQMIRLADLPIDDRLVTHLSTELISDGGQWDMVVNLLENYGLVPQAFYPESTHSSLSSPLNRLLKTRLREHALTLRNLAETLRGAHVREETVMATVRAKKEELMKEIYNIMTATLGVPPPPTKQFVWEYLDGDGKVGRWEGSPKEFYEITTKPYSSVEYFSLINDPRNQYSTLYTVEKLGNVWGGRPVLYVNTEIENMKSAVVKMIKAGFPVFFGCDMGNFYNQESGIMDASLFEYSNAFDIEFKMSKADRLRACQSSMTHAMVFTGVHVDPITNKPIRYQVENSWGKDVGKDGFFVMTDSWFEEYVFQVVVPKALAPRELVLVYEAGKTVQLPPWDPMGSLA